MERTDPPAGRWYAADDIDSLVRELDVLINGEAGAAQRACLIDVVAQLRRTPIEQQLASAKAAGIALAAKWVSDRATAYDGEHGSTDGATGTREYPSGGDEYIGELQEIAEGIDALRLPMDEPEHQVNPWIRADSVEAIVSDAELASAFENTSFGGEPRNVLRRALLKCLAGFHQGYTSRAIAQGLGLISKTYQLTDKGRMYVWESNKTRGSI